MARGRGGGRRESREEIDHRYIEPEIKDEYTLGKKSDEKLFVPLDSVYERDFDQKFLMNKHNFE